MARLPGRARRYGRCAWPFNPTPGDGQIVPFMSCALAHRNSMWFSGQPYNHPECEPW
jgi:hypothetical protein